MKCENYFCIYNEDDRCSLSEISLDVRGSCESCILMECDELLEQKRRAYYLRLLEEWEPMEF